MHHQKHHCSLADRQCICNSSKRHHGGFEYDSCREQQKEDINIPGTQECPSVCYYPGDSELPHAYLQNETESCLSDSESDFGEMCHQTNVHDVHHVQMDPCFQTCDGRELNPEVSHSQRMNEEPEPSEDTLRPCRTVDSRWSSNQWPSLPPPCCNVRNALVVGMEVDVLEEVVYEDTEIVQTQTMFDGCLEDHMMDSTSCYCDQLFFM
ncbi:hypothetical protein KOW79_016651 [Hemibagrus wyckioides]|uniref:Uncharacterized protein n=1 Tax=Hemibagrus wyckioides TaxID=337641 RepID=A0A9D3NAS9_9TELE|nr:uncharacterized protein LOC131370999 [Hemibagrus wyckioides]KAG7319508.1 hypothetical protein KOW79_016651 [Hemibagrus wyckioides]